MRGRAAHREKLPLLLPARPYDGEHRDARALGSVGQRGAYGASFGGAQGGEDAGGPHFGVSCSLTDTTTERRPSELAAMNWV